MHKRLSKHDVHPVHKRVSGQDVHPEHKKVNDNTVHRVHKRASYLTSGGAPENKSPGIPPMQNRISDQAIHLAQTTFQSTIQFHHQSFDGLYQQFILEQGQGNQ